MEFPPRARSSELSRAARILAAGKRVVVLTGAGISTDSGIPDFRGPQGVWTRNPGAEKQTTLANYVADAGVRRAAWRARAETFAVASTPNAGHRALVELEQTGRLHTLVTQNIDGLHLAAGTSPGLLVEIHGTVREVDCLSCGERLPMETALARWRSGEEDPQCLRCGGILKSATISFGQALVAADLRRALRAAAECDVLLAIGSTLGVYPVAEMVPVAHSAGARVIIVNGQRTELDHLADVVVRGSISEVLVQLVRAGSR